MIQNTNGHHNLNSCDLRGFPAFAPASQSWKSQIVFCFVRYPQEKLFVTSWSFRPNLYPSLLWPFSETWVTMTAGSSSSSQATAVFSQVTRATHMISKREGHCSILRTFQMSAPGKPCYLTRETHSSCLYSICWLSSRTTNVPSDLKIMCCHIWPATNIKW